MSKKKSESEGPSALGGTPNDLAASILKSVVGLTPVAGPILAEIVGHTIPNQRIDRLEDFARKLAARFALVEDKLNVKSLKSNESVALFEEGAFQSARATTDIRREYVANLVAHGMCGDEKERIESRRLLDLLRQIDDDQIIILASYLSSNYDNDEFLEKHADVLEPVGAHLGSEQEEIDRETVYRLTRDQLTTLKLIQPRFKKPRKDELPEFDYKSGTVKATSNSLTPLGHLLLVRLGLAAADD